MTFTGALLWSLALLLGAALTGPGATPLSAQSIVAGEVEGEITDTLGRPVQGAAVTLTEERSGIGRTRRTTSDGTFAFEFTPGGSYELRVEALGYRPRVILGIDVTPGDRVRVPVDLLVEPPPVQRADTTRWGGAGGGGANVGRRLGPAEISSLPDRARDVAALLEATSWSDPVGGLEGLPVGFTALYADGERVFRAEHPSLADGGEPLGLLFPRIGLQSAAIRTGLEDIEWGGSTGSLVSLETRSGMGRASGELFGLWSDGRTWTNEVVGEGPELLSAWGGGTASIPLIPDSALVAISVEGGMVETPNIFWRNDYYTGRVLSGAPEPGLRSRGYGAGSARVDWLLDGGTRITARAGFSSFRNETDRLGMPQPGYGTELPGEGVDGSLAAVVGAPLSETLLLEFRGAVGFSNRTWEQGEDSLPGAWLVSERALLGTNPSFPATNDRISLTLSPVLHYRSGPNRIKAGARVSRDWFDVSHVEQSPGAYFFGSRAALLGGQGAAVDVAGPVPAVDFNKSQIGLFGQYRWSARPGLDVTTGLSWRLERLPVQDVQPATEWAGLTGITNLNPDRSVNGFGGLLHLRWDLRGDGNTWLVGGMGVEYGLFDVGALHEVLTLDGPVRARRAFGEGLDWETGGMPGDAVTATRLAILGPDLEPPRTTRGFAGLFQSLPAGMQLGLTTSFRRTEALLRRTDLNRLAEPVGTDQDGRPVFGDLGIVAGTLFADPATNRRFPDFESVWALSSDGWSEYTGFTASLEVPLGREGSLTARYTWSETTDNWFGAAEGGALATLAPELPDPEWHEGRSDFDIPHRLSVLGVLPLPLPWGGEIAGLYRYRSDRPFTARVAAGLDANGDGSPFNDPAFIPASGSTIEALATEWDCLAERAGQFAERNGCRGDPIHTFDVRVSLGLPPIGGVAATLTIDGLGLTDPDTGIRDDNLLLLGGGSVEKDDDGIEVPYRVNPRFGEWVFRGDPGRMLRVGLRIGGIR